MTAFDPVLLTLPSFTPSLVVEVLPHGLTIHRIIVQADGRTHDIVIGPETLSDHLTQKYTNTIVGRYANRIPVGTHQLERHGIKSQLTTLPNESPRVSLHGGPTGFDSNVWERITSPTLFSKTELSHLPSAESWAVFRLISQDGDQGFPGTLLVEALVSLVGPGEQEKTYVKPGDKAAEKGIEYDLGSVVLVYRAKLTDGSIKVVTPVNLTQHWGFNLDASLRESESLSIKEHILTIKADRVTQLDSDSLATGVLLPTANTPHAHESTPISAGFPPNGYDDFYVFAPPTVPLTPTRIPLSEFTPESDLLDSLLRPSNSLLNRSSVVELASQKSGLKLAFQTNQTGVMLYTNNLANPSNGSRKKIHGGSGNQGDGYGPGMAAFLEFHEPLASFLDPAKKDAEDTLLTSDELYHNYVRLDVKFYESRPSAS